MPKPRTPEAGTGRTTCPVVGGPHGEPVAVERAADAFGAPQAANRRTALTKTEEENRAAVARILAPLEDLRRQGDPEEAQEQERPKKPESLGQMTRLMERLREIEAFFRGFMDSPLFHEPTEEQEREMLAPTPPADVPQKLPRVPKGMEPYLASLFEVPLLTYEQEVHLFRKMNFLRHCGRELLATLDPKRLERRKIRRIFALYADAIVARNEIERANLRLVVSVAKGFATKHDPLGGLISDGNISLGKAIDKYDFARRFKFSTYATWAIRKNFMRTVADGRRHSSRFATNRAAWEQKNEEDRDDGDPSRLLRQHRTQQAFVRGLLDRLDGREREVIVGRFGLNGREPQTLKQVGASLGVTKERIRQIENRALGKMRDLMEEEGRDPDDLEWESVRPEPEDFDDESSPGIPPTPLNPHPPPARRRRGRAVAQKGGYGHS